MRQIENPASMAFTEANDRIRQAGEIEFTGNPDVNFVRGTIPHRQAAVEFAKVEPERGQDPEVCKPADGILAAQEAVIKWKQDRLAGNGGRSAWLSAPDMVPCRETGGPCIS